MPWRKLSSISLLRRAWAVSVLISWIWGTIVRRSSRLSAAISSDERLAGAALKGASGIAASFSSRSGQSLSKRHRNRQCRGPKFLIPVDSTGRPALRLVLEGHVWRQCYRKRLLARSMPRWTGTLVADRGFGRERGRLKCCFRRPRIVLPTSIPSTAAFIVSRCTPFNTILTGSFLRPAPGRLPPRCFLGFDSVWGAFPASAGVAFSSSFCLSICNVNAMPPISY